MLMCNGVRFKSTFQAVFLGEFLAGCRFFKISVAQPVCPWPATRRWPPWKTRNYCKVFIRSIKFNRTELMLLKHLSKILFTFRSQVMQKLVPAKVTITSTSKAINSALFLFCTYYSAFYVYIFGTSFGVIFIVTTIECFTDLRDPDNAVSSRNYTL